MSTETDDLRAVYGELRTVARALLQAGALRPHTRVV